MLPGWEERAKIYKSRKYENPNQQGVETYLINGLIAWGDTGISFYYKLLLEKGRWFLGRDRVDDNPVCVNFRQKFKPKIKECFYNAQMFVTSTNEGKYYEGFCCDGTIPVLHAWIVLNNKVIDFTLETRRKLFETEGIPAYLGVEIPNNFVKDRLIELECASPLAHKYTTSTKNEKFSFNLGKSDSCT